MARDLATFIVPDLRLARAAGLDLEAAGLRPVVTARHATVLLLVGAVPNGLASAASIVYSQMPRPRAILATGVSPVADLPEPDVITALDQAALQAGVALLRKKLAAGAFAPEVEELALAEVQTRTRYVCPMHPQVVRDDPGSCPICGMDLVAHEASPAAAGQDHHHAGGTAHGGTTTPDHAAGAVAFTCLMHPQIVQPTPGRCPICGMPLVPTEEEQNRHLSPELPKHAGEHSAHEPAGGDHRAHTGHGARHAERGREGADGSTRTDGGQDHGAVAHGAGTRASLTHGEPDRDAAMARDNGGDATAISTMDHAAMNHAGGTREALDHDGMDHGTVGHAKHGEGGFMSMVAMTADLPRSADGLPMEWFGAPFGPLFPGLPGGLDVTFTLDGDGVASAALTTGVTGRGLEATWVGPVDTFPARLARVDPLAPVAYRLLAQRALEAVAGVEIDEQAARARIRDAEWERVGSHLGWLAAFGSLIGDRWVAGRAAALQLAVARARKATPLGLIREIREVAGGVAHAPFIASRLRGIGEVGTTEPDWSRGPVARAAGITTDRRADDAGYQALGFVPVLRTRGDALARLQVRLEEIATSLDLVRAATDDNWGVVDDAPLPPGLFGAAEATVETPRGAARLHVMIENGSVIAAHLDSPSALHIRLVPDISAGAEVADALVAIASLDLSPWEVDR